jgi:DNA-binding beta-propeller fold protein YncE
MRSHPVVIGVCAVALVLSLSACHTGGPAAAPASAPPASAASAPTGAAPGTVMTVRATRSRHALGRRVRISAATLGAPDAIAAAGSRVWVANSRYEDGGAGWVTELSATTGALIRVIEGQRYAFTDPQALAVDGNTLWVADGHGNAVTEINATTGALIRVITGRRYQFSDPAAIAAAGGSAWVASGGANSLTQISAASGALIRVISARQYQLSTDVYAPAIAVSANRVWVPDANGNAVTEINATTGALIRVITGRRYQFNGPDQIALAGDRAWVVNVNTPSVTEINAATGALIRVITRVPNVPFAITADGGGVWVVTNLGEKAVDGTRPDGAVAEFSAGSGRLVRYLSGVPFQPDNPGGAIAAAGGGIWVTDTNFYSHRGWVAEVSAATGRLARVIS